MRGQTLFFGKAQCATCHPAPYYTDNSMHDLKVERFYKTQTINGLVATSQGPIKTFTLRGIKESPPYFHDGRLLTLEDTVEFFNLILETEADRCRRKRPGGVHAPALRRRHQNKSRIPVPGDTGGLNAALPETGKLYRLLPQDVH